MHCEAGRQCEECCSRNVSSEPQAQARQSSNTGDRAEMRQVEMDDMKRVRPGCCDAACVCVCRGESVVCVCVNVEVLQQLVA